MNRIIIDVVGHVEGMLVMHWWSKRKQYWRYVVQGPEWFQIFSKYGNMIVELPRPDAVEDVDKTGAVSDDDWRVPNNCCGRPGDDDKGVK